MRSALSRLVVSASSQLSAHQVDYCNLWFQTTRSVKRYPSKGWKVITGKRGKVNFYKGRGVKNAGVHSSRGRFSVLPGSTPNYIVPDLRLCELGPYVTLGVCPLHKLKAKQEPATQAEPQAVPQAAAAPSS